MDYRPISYRMVNPRFTAKFWEVLQKALGIEHPQTDGQAEVKVIQKLQKPFVLNSCVT